MDTKSNLPDLSNANILIKRIGDDSDVKYFESYDSICSIKQEIDEAVVPVESIKIRIKNEIIDVEANNPSLQAGSIYSSRIQCWRSEADKYIETCLTHIPKESLNVIEPIDLDEDNPTIYGGKEDTVNLNGLFACEKCSYVAQTDKCLEIHMRVHLPLKKCVECDYIAANRYQFRVHMKQMHPGITPYKCNECDYTTMKKAHLSKHIICHSGDKPFVCENCDFKTTKQIFLNRHMKIHTGKNLYYCDLCDYKTNQKSGLSQHLRKHTGERPFSCSSCDYTARTAHQLKVHEMRHHSGDSPYQCSTCGLKTGDKTKLTVHMRIHTGEKPFECDLCGYKLTQKSSLIRHKKTHERARKDPNVKKVKRKRLPFEQVYWVTKVEPDSSAAKVDV